MKISLLTCSMCVLSLVTVCSAAVADSEPRIALIWQQGIHYKVGDVVNYDGVVFKALAGSFFKRPDVNAADGWRKLNDCDDSSKGAVRCEPNAQARIVSTEEGQNGYRTMYPLALKPTQASREATEENFRIVQDYMAKRTNHGTGN